MRQASEEPDSDPDSLDRIALDLQELREAAGPVSYGELVRRIGDMRVARGVPASAAYPARSTVYNALRTGRTRMDSALLRDIVLALGADDADADAWVRRCRRMQRTVPAAPTSTPRAPASVTDVSTSAVVLLLIACTALNLLGLSTTHIFRLSVYLDMIGTALAAFMLGPWHGVVVAVASSNLGFVTGDTTTFLFTPVNVGGALVWGYGIRRFRLGSTISRFFSLNIAVALCCSLIAAPLVVLFFGGHSGHASSAATQSLESLGLPLIASVFSANIVTSIIDKLLTGFIALLIFSVLQSRFALPTSHMPLADRSRSLRVRIDPASSRSARAAT